MLDDNYTAGTSSTEMVLVIAIGIILIALLIAVQVLVTQRSNRILNIALVTATIVVLVLVGWTVVRFVSAQNSLQSAQRDGSDSVQLLSGGAHPRARRRRPTRTTHSVSGEQALRTSRTTSRS